MRAARGRGSRAGPAAGAMPAMRSGRGRPRRSRTAALRADTPQVHRVRGLATRPARTGDVRLSMPPAPSIRQAGRRRRGHRRRARSAPIPATSRLSARYALRPGRARTGRLHGGQAGRQTRRRIGPRCASAGNARRRRPHPFAPSHSTAQGGPAVPGPCAFGRGSGTPRTRDAPARATAGVHRPRLRPGAPGTAAGQ